MWWRGFLSGVNFEFSLLCKTIIVPEFETSSCRSERVLAYDINCRYLFVHYQPLHRLHYDGTCGGSLALIHADLPLDRCSIEASS
mgnify:CR=1 FL=1